MKTPQAACQENQKLYERLYVAAEDLDLARQYAQHLLKKGWHSGPWERRGSIYMQQSAFVTALVVSYARAFNKSHGWPLLPKDILPENQIDLDFHEHLLSLRHQIYAHSDSKHHKVQPWRIDSKMLTDIRGAPAMRFTKDECQQIIELIGKLKKPLLLKIGIMRAEILDT